MTTAHRTSKHRATQPLPAAGRPAPTGAHRASRLPAHVLTAFLGTVLIVLLMILGVRG